jgi:hypothetical protein
MRFEKKIIMPNLKKSKIYIMGFGIFLYMYLLINPSASGDTQTDDGGAAFMKALAKGGENAIKQIEQEAVCNPINIKQMDSSLNEKFETWIMFLYGCVIDTNKLSSNFPYNSAKAFRSDSDDNLETIHNYIQVTFPNYKQSDSANFDLYLKNTKLTTNKSVPGNVLKHLLSKFISLEHKIRLNMMLNASRMFRFWGLEYAIDASGNAIIRTGHWTGASIKLPNDNHNNKRVTRVLHALGIFGLGEMKKAFIVALANCFGRLNSDNKTFNIWLNTIYPAGNNIHNKIRRDLYNIWQTASLGVKAPTPKEKNSAPLSSITSNQQTSTQTDIITMPSVTNPTMPNTLTAKTLREKNRNDRKARREKNRQARKARSKKNRLARKARREKNRNDRKARREKNRRKRKFWRLI